ncbi:MAG: ATP-binding cassette domain-containing protein [Calditerrivibrio sp.]|nr:ATP-binding cassette domain-containing protein [Calditerrivibrio sp.]MCA1932805.1 ATP-binding cassette domain-containing protein [Calditerrivibrio sp.]MCA1980235.1 ATP-binding cassette domain-containing protein [Calditerrivibrio sp.]
MDIVSFQDCCFSYDGNNNILENLTINFKKDRFTAILGESGCGKTTILNLIIKRLSPTSGVVVRNFSNVGVVLQADSLIDNISVLRNVMYVCNDKDKAIDALKLVEMEEFSKNKAKTLSKGMKKRVEIARALSIKPDLVIMDEPFANLDHFTKISLVASLKHFIKNSYASFIYITHDIDEALVVSDTIVAFNKRPLNNYLKIDDIQLKDKKLVKNELMGYLNSRYIPIR